MADEEVKAEFASRKVAKRAGASVYFTGKPCRNGHIALRQVSDGGCKACKRETCRRAYTKNPAKFRAKTRAYYQRNSEAVRAKRVAYHHATYHACEKTKAVARARTKKWAADNPEKARANHRNGKAKRKSIPGFHTDADVARIMKQQRGRCAYCRQKLKQYQVDHIVAVANGGTNDPSNIQLTCGKCNREKSARDPISYAQMIGLLL